MEEHPEAVGVPTMSFDWYPLGAEEAGWRRLLIEQGATNLAYGYSNLKRRTPKGRLRHRPGIKQLLDSGGRIADKNPGRRTPEQWLTYEEGYFEFVSANIEALDYVLEFDAQMLGHEHIMEMRERIWSTIPEEKFVPVWYPSEDLEEMARNYVNIAIPEKLLTPLVARKLPHLPVNAFGIQAGPAMCRFLYGNISSAWLGPSQFGETVVWDGHRLHTHSKKDKESARRRHRASIEKAGFDTTKVEASDPIEVTKLAVWSWLRHAEGGGAALPPDAGDGRVDQVPGVALAEIEHLEQALVDQPRVPLPVISSHGEIANRTLRECDHCLLANRCPAFRPGEPCAYEIPVKVGDRASLLSLLQGVIEMQSQRVLFARFVEEMEGGYGDPTLSAEMDRLMKVIYTAKEISSNEDFLKITVEAKGSAGVLSRLFGEKFNDGPPELIRPTG